MKFKNFFSPLYRKDKPARVKKYYARKMMKDLKRVRWPDGKKNWSSFIKIIIFTLIVVAFVFITSTIFTLLWANIGVGP